MSRDDKSSWRGWLPERQDFESVGQLVLDVAASLDLWLAKFRKKVTSHPPTEQTNKPPILGVVLIELFAPKNRVKAVLGDLEEQFNEDCATRRPRDAKLLYWARVIRTVGPLFLTKLRNWGLFAVVVRWLSGG